MNKLAIILTGAMIALGFAATIAAAPAHASAMLGVVAKESDGFFENLREIGPAPGVVDHAPQSLLPAARAPSRYEVPAVSGAAEL